QRHRRGDAAADRRNDRRQVVPRARHRGARRHLRRDRPDRAGGARCAPGATVAGALPVAAGRGLAVRAAVVAAASPGGAMTALHFLRPEWLWLLLLLPPLAWWLRRRTRRDGPWRDAVDPHLLPHLLDARDGSKIGRESCRTQRC